MLGMHGTKTSNLGVTKCDLLIAIGARFSDRVTGTMPRNLHRHAKIVHIDVDAAEINKNVMVDCSIIGDVKRSFRRVKSESSSSRIIKPGWKQIEDEGKISADLSIRKVLTGPGVIEELYQATNGDAIIVTEVGQHQMWAAQYYKYNDAPYVSYFRRSGNHGIWSWSSHRCQNR
ncbi:MAG: hypothetical protein ACLVAT_02820 [Lachnospiraceae bacterium]